MIAETKILGMTLSEEVVLCISYLDLHSKGSQDDANAKMLGLGARHQISLTHLAAAPSSFTRAFALLALQSPCLLPGTMQGLQGKSQRSSPVRIISSRAGAGYPYRNTFFAITFLRCWPSLSSELVLYLL